MDGTSVDKHVASDAKRRSRDTLPISPLLDYFLTLARSFHILLVMSIAAGAIAYFVAPHLPQVYESESTIALSASEMRTVDALLRTPTLLDTIIDRHAPRDNSQTNRRVAVDGRFQFVPAKGADTKIGGMYRLVTTGGLPAAAQALNRDLLEAWFAASQSRAFHRDKLQGQIARAEESLSNQTSLIGRLERESVSLVISGMIQELMVSIDALRERREKTIQLIDMLKRQLTSGERDRLVSGSTLPVEPVWPVRSRLAAATAVATALLLLAFVTLRHFWRRGMAEPVLAARLREIRAALVPFQKILRVG